jgi:U3 small nucleolar RNA-associated protein 22
MGIVICTLEGSGKWPEEYEAMKRLKVAFHIQLADAIKSEFNVPVKVGLGYVDVLKVCNVFLYLNNDHVTLLGYSIYKVFTIKADLFSVFE